MKRSAQADFEQVPLALLLENSHEEFSHALHSASARFVLWASFKDEKSLIQNWAEARGRSSLFDKRRTRTMDVEELKLKRQIEDGAAEAATYITWARRTGGQPILREILVSYCMAFETCLKNVALVFLLAAGQNGGLSTQRFVSVNEFNKALRQTEKNWKTSGESGLHPAEDFYQRYVFLANPDIERYHFVGAGGVDWATSIAAIKIRNAVVHQLARPSEQIELLGQVFTPREEVFLEHKHLYAAREAFMSILFPLNPNAFIFP